MRGGLRHWQVATLCVVLSLFVSRGFATEQAELVEPASETLELNELEPSPRRSELFLPNGSTPEDVLRRLEMERGKATVVKTGYGVKRVAVGDPEVVDFVVLGTREIQLVAKSVGDTNVLIWDKNGRLQSAIDVHVGAVRAQLVRELQRVLDNSRVSVDMAGESVVLRGSVASLADSEKATKVARALFAERGRSGAGVINLLEVGGNHQVMIEVIIAEMSRTVTKNLGFNATAVFGDGRDSFYLFSFLDNLVTVSDLFGVQEKLVLSENINLIMRGSTPGSRTITPFIQALEEQGLLSILAEPTLVARSGEMANFLVGGEVAIPITQGSGDNITITIEFKKFGVSVDFLPTVLSPDRIHLHVAPEVSEPDFTFGTTVSGTTVPGFKTRRASTGLELADGQSFAIAGLLRDEIISEVAQYPGFGDIPVLGALFRSNSFQKRQTELVLIVRPRLVKPLGPEPIPLPTDHYVEPNDWEYYGLGRLEGSVENPQSGRGGVARNGVDPDRASEAPGGLVGKFGPRLPVPAPKAVPTATGEER